VSLLKADHPNITCCIVGDGPEKKDLMKLSNEMGICKNVEFAVFRNTMLLSENCKLQRFLCFLLPGRFRHGCNRSICCGVPVVTVKRGTMLHRGWLRMELMVFLYL
jgi:glycosyltransferase involved in cell wall biosynthesis